MIEEEFYMTTGINAQKVDTVKMANAINEWDMTDALVLTQEVNGVIRRISIDTINGQKVRGYGYNYRNKNEEAIQSEIDKNVESVFPLGLPKGISATFISVAK